MKNKFPIRPEECSSTHGGSGYVLGSYYENGSVICGACGMKCDLVSVGTEQGEAVYPNYIIGIPYNMTREGKRVKKDGEMKNIAFILLGWLITSITLVLTL